VTSVEPTNALLHKLSIWLTEPDNERVIHDLEAEVEVAVERGAPGRGLDRPDAEDDTYDGPMLIDVVLFDGVLVPRLHRRHVLDLVKLGDGLGLLRWIANPNPMPRLQNMEGEPLLFVMATYRVADPAAAARALGRRLRDDGDGRFVETFERRGQDWTRGSITLDGDRATIDANSAKRAARLERALLRAAPGSRLIRREERGVEEALDEQCTSGKPAEAIDVAAHPEPADAMEQVMRRFETTWVDESIPASEA
jgi:hypothetical protein